MNKLIQHHLEEVRVKPDAMFRLRFTDETCLVYVYNTNIKKYEVTHEYPCGSVMITFTKYPMKGLRRILRNKNINGVSHVMQITLDYLGASKVMI
jgi:hypothetical protein